MKVTSHKPTAITFACCLLALLGLGAGKRITDFTNALTIADTNVFEIDIGGASRKANFGAIATNLQSRFGTDSHVEFWGATGDGVTDDTTSIQSAITAAGTNGTLMFASRKTYIVSRPLNPVAGQTWIGHGAVLKRPALTLVTTANTISAGAGQHSIDLTDATAFPVGTKIAVYTNALSLTGYDPSVKLVTARSGNNITVAFGFTHNFATGASVVQAGEMITVDQAHVTLQGLTLDENGTVNTNIAKWQLSQLISASGNQFTMIGCTLRNAIAEGMFLGGEGSTVTGCILTNIGGNGIHLVNARNTRIANNYFARCNLSGTNSEHADGCVSASANVYDTTIAKNFMDTARAGSGGWNSTWNRGVIIEGNVMTNCYVASIGMGGGNFDATIANNRISACGPLSITGTNVAVIGNTFLSSRLTGSSFSLVTIANNTFLATGSEPAIALTNVNFSKLVNNTVSGGHTNSVFITGSFNHNVSGNQHSGSLLFGNSFPTNAYTVHGDVGLKYNLVVDGAVGIGTTNTPPTYGLEVNPVPNLTGGARLNGLALQQGLHLQINPVSGTASWLAGVGIPGIDATSFVLRDETSAANRLVIRQNGNAGVGTSTPSSAWDVGGNGEVRAGTANFTNGITTTYGTLCKSNAVALPSAATIGAGGYWVGNSNGTLVSLSSLDGTTTVMKQLAP